MGVLANGPPPPKNGPPHETVSTRAIWTFPYSPITPGIPRSGHADRAQKARRARVTLLGQESSLSLGFGECPVHRRTSSSSVPFRAHAWALRIQNSRADITMNLMEKSALITPSNDWRKVATRTLALARAAGSATTAWTISGD